MDELVRLSIEKGVARVRMNRPEKLNVLDFALGEALLAALGRVEHDRSVKVVTLTGEGRAFMAGGDIDFFHAAGDRAPEEVPKLIALFHQIIHSIRRMRPPVIAGVQGAAAGGGLGLALACDLVVATENASFVPAYTRLGTSPDGGTTWSITRLIGARRAMEWIALGEPMNAKDALTLGLINRVVANDKLDAELDALTRRLAEGPAFAIASVKRLVQQASTVPLDVQLEAERDAFTAAAGTKDFREGVEAFVARRTPRFGAD